MFSLVSSKFLAMRNLLLYSVSIILYQTQSSLALITFTPSNPQGLGAVLPFAFDLAKSQQFNELFIDNFNCLP